MYITEDRYEGMKDELEKAIENYSDYLEKNEYIKTEILKLYESITKDLEDIRNDKKPHVTFENENSKKFEYLSGRLMIIRTFLKVFFPSEKEKFDREIDEIEAEIKNNLSKINKGV